MIRISLAAVALGLSWTTANAQAPLYYNGYTKQNGNYVAPHYQTAPNNNPYDNYSTRGNVNPYTGQPGTVAPQQDSNPYATKYPRKY
jgi:hypothetical protein